MSTKINFENYFSSYSAARFRIKIQTTLSAVSNLFLDSVVTINCVYFSTISLLVSVSPTIYELFTFVYLTM